MNRDALLATLIGFGIGLVIMGLVLVTPKLIKDFPKFSLPKINLNLSGKKVKPSPTPISIKFTITSPLPESIESKSDVLVSGTADPGSIIVIAGDIDETVAVASDDGKYAGKITLSEGTNSIEVTTYKDNKVQSQTVTVYSTPENF